MKDEAIIGLIILVVVGLVSGLLFSVYSPGKSSLNRESPPLETQTKTPNFTGLVSTGQNMCEGCHLSGKKYIPQAYQIKQHAEGGAYCLECHKIDHNIHPINKNVKCERCHGISGQIPAFRNGTIACAECHDFPDPLNPSNGNLIVIHRPRNVDCARCHIDSYGSCLKCHNEIKSDSKWGKRLNHFNTILKTAQ